MISISTRRIEKAHGLDSYKQCLYLIIKGITCHGAIEHDLTLGKKVRERSKLINRESCFSFVRL